MAEKIVIFMITLGVCLFSVQCQEPCILHLKDYEKTPVFRPFVYTLDGKLQKSHNYEIRIPNGQDALLSCENNFFKNYPELHNLTVKCDDDTLLVIHDKSKQQFKSLNCEIRVIEEIKHTVSGCTKPNKGTYIQYFNARESIYFILAEMCYNNETEQISFIRTQLPYNAEPRLQHDKFIPSDVDIPHKIAMLTAYRADKMDLALKKLLSDEYDFAHQSVISIKLLPKLFYSDQLYEVEKFETNFVGIWVTVAKGNWLRVMHDINDYTKEMKKPVEVIVGTHGTLSLPTPSGKTVDVNLVDDRVPLPRFVWAVVHNKQKKQAVVIITLNNPFISIEDIKKEVFCENICEKITWLHRTLKNRNYDRAIYGYTFCCSMDSFKVYPHLESTALLKD